jgi:voltage-gated potassium channel
MSLNSGFKRIIRTLRKERFFLFASITLIVIGISSIGAFIFEHNNRDASIHSLWDGIWWAVVTLCTVGYGDKFPVSTAGRLVALVLMISGIGLLSLVTATIASVFVEQKIKEGKGLETIKEKNHIVICGWNPHTEDVLVGLSTYSDKESPVIVLVNELPIEEIDTLKLKYARHDLHFIRGNHSNEDVLIRANVKRARFVVLMSDTSGTQTKDRADERTILSALTIKSLAPKVKIVAELLDSENRPYLKRAKVDEIIIMEEFMGSLLASAVTYPGLSKVFSNMMSLEDNNKMRRTAIPDQFIGKTFGELSRHFRETRSAILIGLLKEKKSFNLEDVLTDDTSAIELFIKEKLKESKKELLLEQDKIRAIINPGDDTVIGENDYAVLLDKIEL